MLRNLDVGTLRSFAAVVDAGGVTRAASRLNLTQSAVSMQIKRLEQNLDTTLLDRTGRGVTVTNKLDVILTTEAKANPAAECLAVQPLMWFGAPGGKAWTRDPVCLASAKNCAFKPVAQRALENADMQWCSGVETDTDLGATIA